ncbi:hypothetical protein SFRURICE_001793 [Spodoptera frugiperda]|nr:hypothetical protein SFRURICE_001793 [Spodoptera frugiperda]
MQLSSHTPSEPSHETIICVSHKEKFRADIETAIRCVADGCPGTALTVQSIALPPDFCQNTARLVRWLGNWLPRNGYWVRFELGATLCVIHILLFYVWL